MPREEDDPPSITLEILARASFVSGEQSTISVAFVNESEKEVTMIFEHACVGYSPDKMFELEASDGRGSRVNLEQHKVGGVGIIGLLNTGCPFPYFRAKLPPEGRISVEIPFEVSANGGVYGPGMQPGPLAPGVYKVDVVTPLVRPTSFTGKFRLDVLPP